VRLFTPEEANETLPLVRARVERLVRRRRELHHVGRRLEVVRASVSGNGGNLDPARVTQLEEQAAQLAAELSSLVEEIHGLGVLVKDLDVGLIDFPATHPTSRATVLLCWQLGEDEVAHWHGVEEGFAGRKPLPF
jgi:hypothetical protein